MMFMVSGIEEPIKIYKKSIKKLTWNITPIWNLFFLNFYRFGAQIDPKKLPKSSPAPVEKRLGSRSVRVPMRKLRPGRATKRRCNPPRWPAGLEGLARQVGGTPRASKPAAP